MTNLIWPAGHLPAHSLTPMSEPRRYRRIALFAAPIIAAVFLTVPAGAAATLTVAQAISSQSGTGTVTGYVVGEPTATDTVRTSGFTGDTALALADSRGEPATSRMLYVQITSTYRSSFGLLSNPG